MKLEIHDENEVSLMDALNDLSAALSDDDDEDYDWSIPF